VELLAGPKVSECGASAISCLPQSPIKAQALVFADIGRRSANSGAGPAVLGSVGAIDADAPMILTHQCSEAISEGEQMRTRSLNDRF